MLLTKKAIVKWNGSSKRWYTSRGYEWTKSGNEFEVDIEDLNVNSKVMVEFVCDYCGNIQSIAYQYYLNNRERCIVKKDACKLCKNKKLKEANLLKYGVENVKQLESSKEKARETQLRKYGATNVMKLEEYKNKLKETLLEKYGVENVMELDFVKDKIKETNLEKYGTECSMNNEKIRSKIIDNNISLYGVTHYSMTEECKQRIRDTNREKYGKDYYSQTNDYVNQIKKTTLERYGVDNVSQCEHVKLKKARTFYENQTVATSKQQRYLWHLLGGIINYSNNTPTLDIAFVDEKIYIEYNGSGHDLCVKLKSMSEVDFQNRERARYYYMKKLGWKAIIIESPRDYLPSDDVILGEIASAKEWLSINGDGHSHFIISIGNKINDVVYGKLRVIKDNDLILRSAE